MFVLFIRITSIFFVAAIGGFFHLREKLDLDSINRLILYLASPCLIFYTVYQHQDSIQTIFQYGLGMGLVIVGMLVLTKLIFWEKVGDKRSIFLTTGFMNTANMGFPLTIIFFGEKAFPIAVVYDLTMIVVLFSVGVSILNGKGGLFGGLKLPAIYALSLALFFPAVGISVPELILDTCQMIGGLLIPLMLISFGARLSEVKIVPSKLALPLFLSFIRFIGGMIVSLGVLQFISLSLLAQKVLILYAILPAPMMSFVLARKYGFDDLLAAETVLVSTVLSFIYIPIVMSFVV